MSTTVVENARSSGLLLFRVVKQMEGMTGMQVLKMQRKELEAVFGKDEGARLDSQITLSRFRHFYKLINLNSMININLLTSPSPRVSLFDVPLYLACILLFDFRG